MPERPANRLLLDRFENQRARRLYESDGWSDDDLTRDDEVFGVIVSQVRYRRVLVEPSDGPTSDEGTNPHA